MTKSQARRVALGAQGFNDPRPGGKIDVRHLRRVLGRIGLLQLDSVNVVVRSHYMPVFSRLGPYPRQAIDDLAYRRAELFEYWGHEASLLPINTYPMYRHRMDGIRPWSRIDGLNEEHPGYIEQVLAEVEEHGPLSVGDLADPGVRTGPWWGYGRGKIALEWLFAKGLLACRHRANFVRYYDIPERVIPADVLAVPALERADAHRQMIRLAAHSHGVATAKELADYYRIRVPDARPRIAELVAAGELEAVSVEGWDRPAYLDPAATLPRRIDARTLLTPFDSVVWERDRAERLFGFRYRIEIYVPKPKREYGYYVMPFLLGDELVARVDLKADRAAGRLLVHGAFSEEGQDRSRVAAALGGELANLATWLGLGAVSVGRNGDLAGTLRAHF